MRVDGSKRQVEHVNVSDLIPYARNPRKHSAQQVKQIAESIDIEGGATTTCAL